MPVRLVVLAALLTAPALMAGVETESVTIPGPGMPEPVRAEVVLPPGSPARLMVFLHDGWGSQRSLHRRGLAEIAAGVMARGEPVGVVPLTDRTCR